MNAPPKLFYPMNEFYEQAGVALPDIVQVQGSEVPEPYRSLLVHDRDMTPTLASAYEQSMQLRVINRILREHILIRQIVLETDDHSKPVIFAAIKIYLEKFPPHARTLILEGQTPFGTILHGQKITHCSRPEAFIRVVSDATINSALQLTSPPFLYGRRSALWNSSDLPLAQVLEILPPSPLLPMPSTESV